MWVWRVIKRKLDSSSRSIVIPKGVINDMKEKVEFPAELVVVVMTRKEYEKKFGAKR
jgi:hypothetical protein